MQPRPESRLSTLEKRASALEASVEELASDQAEELKTIRQTIDANFTELKRDIKQLDEGIRASYVSIGDTFVATWDDIKATLATKEDITKVETRLDRIETRLESTATKDDIAGIILDQHIRYEEWRSNMPEPTSCQDMVSCIQTSPADAADGLLATLCGYDGSQTIAAWASLRGAFTNRKRANTTSNG